MRSGRTSHQTTAMLSPCFGYVTMVVDITSCENLVDLPVILLLLTTTSPPRSQTWCDSYKLCIQRHLPLAYVPLHRFAAATCPVPSFEQTLVCESYLMSSHIVTELQLLHRTALWLSWLERPAHMSCIACSCDLKIESSTLSKASYLFAFFRFLGRFRGLRDLFAGLSNIIVDLGE